MIISPTADSLPEPSVSTTLRFFCGVPILPFASRFSLLEGQLTFTTGTHPGRTLS